MLYVKPEGFDLRSRNGATCSICGAGDFNSNTGTRPGVLSTGVHIEMEGNFDLCFGCVREMAGLVGMISSDAYRLLAAEYEEQSRDLKEMIDKVRDKEDALRLLSAELAQKGGYGTPAPKPERKKPGPKPAKKESAPKLPIGLQ